LTAGMTALVSKPIDEDVLLFEMYKWLCGSGGEKFRNQHYVKNENNAHLVEIVPSTSVINFNYLDSVTKGNAEFV